MAIQKIHIPDIGNFDSVEVIEILISEGDSVEVDDSLVTLESDKATMEIPAPFSGVVKSIQFAVGDSVAEGDYILDIEIGEAVASVSKPVAEKEPVVAEPVSAPASTPVEPVKAAASNVVVAQPVNKQTMGQLSHASPSARSFARKLGVELSLVNGSGPKGRVKTSDIEALVKSVMQGGANTNSTGAGIPSVPVIDFSKFGETTEVALGKIKKISGKFLHTSWLNVPHVTQFDECDITEMDKFRKEMKATAEKEGVKLTPIVFVMKAVVKALQDFPNMNASLSADGQSIIQKNYYNIGIAVDTPKGLVVPVVKDVDKKGIYELSRDLMAISAKARDGKLSPADMSGGSFTISSLGGIGGTQFTPIVNAPEVGIMGLSKAKMQPVWNGSEFVPKLIMPFSVSYDHRAIDGAEGVRFTTTVGKYLADLRQLIL